MNKKMTKKNLNSKQEFLKQELVTLNKLLLIKESPLTYKEIITNLVLILLNSAV